MEQLGQAEVSDSQRKVACIAQDSFYRELTEAEALKASKGLFDFDHPSKHFVPVVISFYLLDSCHALRNLNFMSVI